MEKQKVFIPVKKGSDFNAVISGVTYSGIAKSEEGYFFTEEEFEEFKKGYTRDTVREIASDFINEFKK